jgi:hypothetical protein
VSNNIHDTYEFINLSFHTHTHTCNECTTTEIPMKQQRKKSLFAQKFSWVLGTTDKNKNKSKNKEMSHTFPVSLSLPLLPLPRIEKVK